MGCRRGEAALEVESDVNKHKHSAYVSSEEYNRLVSYGSLAEV